MAELINSFYNHVNFQFLRLEAQRRPNRPPLSHFHHFPAPVLGALMHYFTDTLYDRMGVLRGEYVITDSGQLLITREGEIVSGMDNQQDTHCARNTDQYAMELVNSPDHAYLVEHFDTFPLIERTPVLTHPYGINYFHFTLELMPMFRYFEDPIFTGFMIPKQLMALGFQVDLLRHIAPGKNVVGMQGPIRVNDPILCGGMFHEAGIHYVRQKMNIEVPAGTRRLYLKRPGTLTRKVGGGGMTPEMEAMLESEFGFEAISFGLGEYSIEQQAMLMAGAEVVLSPHGAAMTNMIYLTPKTTVIELINILTPRMMYASIAGALGLPYHCIYTPIIDENYRLVYDLDLFRKTLDAILS